MTFTFDPPRILLVIAAFILIAAVASVVLSTRHPARKILGVVLAAVFVTFLLVRFYTIGASSLAIDSTGIVGHLDGEPEIPWSGVDEAIYVADLSESDYRPTRPTSMFEAIGSLNARYGSYELADGDIAFVALERVRGAAVVVTTPDAIYLFGPHDVQGFAKAIADHVPLAGWDAAAQ